MERKADLPIVTLLMSRKVAIFEEFEYWVHSNNVRSYFSMQQRIQPYETPLDKPSPAVYRVRGLECLCAC